MLTRKSYIAPLLQKERAEILRLIRSMHSVMELQLQRSIEVISVLHMERHTVDFLMA